MRQRHRIARTHVSIVAVVFQEGTPKKRKEIEKVKFASSPSRTDTDRKRETFRGTNGAEKWGRTRFWNPPPKKKKEGSEDSLGKEPYPVQKKKWG